MFVSCWSGWTDVGVTQSAGRKQVKTTMRWFFVYASNAQSYFESNQSIEESTI